MSHPSYLVRGCNPRRNPPHLVVVGYPYGVAYGTDTICEVVGSFVREGDRKPSLVAIPRHASSGVPGSTQVTPVPVVLAPEDENRSGRWYRLFETPEAMQVGIRNAVITRDPVREKKVTMTVTIDEIEDASDMALALNTLAVAAVNIDLSWRSRGLHDARKEFPPKRQKKAKKGAAK